jgi:hypothetical protein
MSSADLLFRNVWRRRGTVDMHLTGTVTQIDFCAIFDIALGCPYRLMRLLNDGPCELFEGSDHILTALRDAAAGLDVKGLCENCENRDNCLLPKSEGGVWHCEEYQ